MDQIDLDEDIIDAEVLHSTRVLSARMLSKRPPSLVMMLVVVVETVKLELQETVQYPVDHLEKFIKYGHNVAVEGCIVLRSSWYW
jgi:transitional endoplasmic reticulum ATPase